MTNMPQDQSSEHHPRKPSENESMPLRYIHAWHYDMLINQERSLFYNNMIEQHCKGKVVLEIGTGSGLMSALAAKHGAKKIICCEENPHLAMAAKQLFERLGIEDKIQFMAKNSKDIKTDEIPAVDVILHELFGSDPFDEEVVPTLTDAKRFLKPDGIFLPEKIQIIYRPLAQHSLPEKIYFDDIHLIEMETLLSHIHPGLRLKDPGPAGNTYFCLPEVSMSQLTEKPYTFTETNQALENVDAVEVSYLIIHEDQKIQAARFNETSARVHWYPLVFLKLDVPSKKLHFSTQDNVKLMIL